MRRTPKIPPEFRSFRPRDCPEGDKHPWCMESRNVYELPGLENEPKLFSSESMVFADGREAPEWPFGDWDCDALLVMQDAAPWDAIQHRVEQQPEPHRDPFSQRNFVEEPTAGGAQTNQYLVRFARHLRCRKLAGNAMIGILKPPGEYSTRKTDVLLMECPWIRGHCIDVIRWVLDAKRTPYLKLVACLGKPALDVVCEAVGVPGAMKSSLATERGRAEKVGRLHVAHTWHPRPTAWRTRVPEGVVEDTWRRMARESGIPFSH